MSDLGEVWTTIDGKEIVYVRKEALDEAEARVRELEAAIRADYDEQERPTFRDPWYALRRIVDAEDMDEAARIAFAVLPFAPSDREDGTVGAT